MAEQKTMKRVEGILRLGLAFSFIYASFAAYLSPTDWLSYFPDFLKTLMPATLLLNSFGLIELTLAIWLIIGKNIFWPSLSAALMLASIIVTNISGFQVLFRDVSIFAMAAALAVWHAPTRKQA